MAKSETQSKGTCGELIAAAALLFNGYDVFMNPTPKGIIDLVAVKDKQVFTFQVKTFFVRRGHKVAETRTSDASGGKYHASYEGEVDKLLLVDVETAEVFMVMPGIRKTQISKAQVQASRIFPAALASRLF